MRSFDLLLAGARWERARDCGVALLLVLLCKQSMSRMDPGQLQWLLWPVAQLLNALGGFDFTPLASGEWLDEVHGLVIVKACAGANFLIASWLGYLWRWRAQPFGLVLIGRAAAAAWLTTIVANALRILCIAHGQDSLSGLTGLDSSESHRLIGVSVYFTCLAIQMGGLAALPAAAAVYVAVTIAMPVAHAWVSGAEVPALPHLAWTAVVPLTALAVQAATLRHKRASSHGNEPGRPVDGGSSE